MKKRAVKKHWTNCFGERVYNKLQEISKHWAARWFINWYKSEYSGSILMGMTILNLLMNPIIDYNVEMDNRVILRKLIIV